MISAIAPVIVSAKYPYLPTDNTIILEEGNPPTINLTAISIHRLRGIEVIDVNISGVIERDSEKKLILIKYRSELYLRKITQNKQELRNETIEVMKLMSSGYYKHIYYRDDEETSYISMNFTIENPIFKPTTYRVKALMKNISIDVENTSKLLEISKYIIGNYYYLDKDLYKLEIISVSRDGDIINIDYEVLDDNPYLPNTYMNLSIIHRCLEVMNYTVEEIRVIKSATIYTVNTPFINEIYSEWRKKISMREKGNYRVSVKDLELNLVSHINTLMPDAEYHSMYVDPFLWYALIMLITARQFDSAEFSYRLSMENSDISKALNKQKVVGRAEIIIKTMPGTSMWRAIEHIASLIHGFIGRDPKTYLDIKNLGYEKCYLPRSFSDLSITFGAKFNATLILPIFDDYIRIYCERYLFADIIDGNKCLIPTLRSIINLNYITLDFLERRVPPDPNKPIFGGFIPNTPPDIIMRVLSALGINLRFEDISQAILFSVVSYVLFSLPIPIAIVLVIRRLRRRRRKRS